MIRRLFIIALCSVILEVYSAPDSPQSSGKPFYSATEIEQILDSKFAQGDYSRTGADQCLRCHEAGAKLDSTGIFDNVHGSRTQPGTPFQGLQCEACHGPAGEHTKSRVKDGEAREPMISFGSNSPVTARKQDSVCLSCHQDDALKHWEGGVHDSANVPCAGCHLVHQREDKIQTRDGQSSACGECHQPQLAMSQQRSNHGLRTHSMQCTDCHNPHGTLNQATLEQATVNQNCFGCHAEKRGPLLWEHEPVTENCANCHNPHGSVNRDLLTMRPPQLCQSCHTSAGHPSTAYGGPEIAGGSAFVAGGSCTNCHSQVHGSNHPSGQGLQR